MLGHYIFYILLDGFFVFMKKINVLFLVHSLISNSNLMSLKGEDSQEGGSLGVFL